jgi:hypothetical protein
MNTNRYFSFSRFGLLLKHDLLELWKSYFRSFCILFILALVVYYLALQSYTIISIDPAHSGMISYIGYHLGIFTFAYSLYMLLKASQFTELLKTKEGRIRQLMLPATSLEKFVSRALGVTVVPTILFIVAILLADVVHFAFFPFFPNLPEELKIWVVPELWKELCAISVADKSATLSVTMNMVHLYVTLTPLIAHSIFVLFGNIFERHGFIAVVGLSSIVSIFNRKFIGGTIDLADWGLTSILESGGGLEVYLINGVCFCLLIFIWWLSYKVFSRKQVIQPKFRL